MTEPAASTPASPTGWRRVILLLVVGAVGGLLSGAFGVGGGIVMVPLFIWLLRMDQRRASATSLAAILPSAIAGAANYLAHGQVDLLAGLLIAAGGVGGSLIGTKLLRTLPLGWLRWGFIALLVVIVVRLLVFEVPDRGSGIEISVGVGIGLVVFGIVMGIASGLFGIGGGVLAVPVLVSLFGASDLVAKGTSLLAMIPTSLSGSVANFRAGLLKPLDSVVAGLAAVAASFAGAAIAFAMPPRVSAVLFAVLAGFVAVQLAVRAIRAHRGGGRAKG